MTRTPPRERGSTGSSGTSCPVRRKSRRIRFPKGRSRGRTISGNKDTGVLSALRDTPLLFQAVRARCLTRLETGCNEGPGRGGDERARPRACRTCRALQAEVVRAPRRESPGSGLDESGNGMRFNRWASCLRSLVAWVRRRPAVASASSGGDRDRDPDDHGGPDGDPPFRSGGYPLRRFLLRRFPGLGRPVRVRFRIRRHAGHGRFFRPRLPIGGRDSPGNGSKAHGEEAGGTKDRDDGLDRRPEMGSAHVMPPLETSNHLGNVTSRPDPVREHCRVTNPLSCDIP